MVWAGTHIIPAEWARFNQMLKIKSEYWEKDAIMEDAVDSMIISLDGAKTSSNETSENDQ